MLKLWSCPQNPARSDPEISLLLEARSLVVLQGHMYESMLHGIAERTEDHVTANQAFANLALCADRYVSFFFFTFSLSGLSLM